MKNNKKNIQAIAVVLIVGMGLCWNTKKSVFHSSTLNPVTVYWQNESVNSDSIRTKENKIFIYTKKIITASIQQLISNL
jgi:hypothetical protein